MKKLLALLTVVCLAGYAIGCAQQTEPAANGNGTGPAELGAPADEPGAEAEQPEAHTPEAADQPAEPEGDSQAPAQPEGDAEAPAESQADQPEEDSENP